MKNHKILLGGLYAIICEVLFGFSYLFTKEIMVSVSPMTLLSWRFIVAFFVLNICVITRIIKLDFKNKSISSLFLAAIFQPVLYFIGETVGIKLTSASESAVIIACIPIITILFSTLILKKAPRKLQVIGGIVTATGIIIIVITKISEDTLNPIGYIMLLFAVVSYSLYTVYSQKAIEFTSMEKIYAMIGIGAVTFTIIALGENAKFNTVKQFVMLPFTNFHFLIAVLYLGIGCSVVSFLLLNKAIEYIGTIKLVSFVGISTMVAVIAGIIILKEEYSTYQIIGILMVIGGVYLANIITKVRQA